jgi:hypothetical protein
MNYLSLFVFYELSVIKNIVSDIYTEIIILYIVQKKFYKIAGLEKGEYDNFIFLIFLNNKVWYSLFRASGYFGQRIISLVIEAVKHSPF